MYIALPLVSSIISLIFALSLLDQFFARRKPYQLIWTVGLLMYFISTGTEFWIEAWGLNEVAYRLWYLVGAMFVAAYLGMGTLYLLTPRRVAHIILVVLLLSSLYAVFRVLTASTDLSSLHNLSGQAMPQGVRLMTPFFNTFGTIALVGGAIYSALIYWRRRIMPYQMISNILIALGAILPAFGGTLMRFGGSLSVFYLLELFGIMIIFTGFLRSREVFGLYRFPLIRGFGRVNKDHRD